MPNSGSIVADLDTASACDCPWTANPLSDGIIEYRVYRTPAFWSVPGVVAPVVGTSYTDTSRTLLPNTQWYYFAVAVNASGTSRLSATALAVIP